MEFYAQPATKTGQAVSTTGRMEITLEKITEAALANALAQLSRLTSSAATAPLCDMCA